MSSEPFKGYMVIIDTDKYAGNFERAMCAFITGVIGECGVGDKEQDIALEELDPKVKEWFKDNMSLIDDEHGCARPVTIEVTPGWFNDGHGTNWKDGADLEEVKATRLASVLDYYTPLIKNAEKCIAEGKTGWRASLYGYKQTIEEAKIGKFTKYPAYNSVGIYFYTLPPANITEVIKSRAEKFTEVSIEATDINIDGFRLKRFTSEEEPW
jgi:hypothetical protein